MKRNNTLAESIKDYEAYLTPEQVTAKRNAFWGKCNVNQEAA